jgi:hypothetical protein
MRRRTPRRELHDAEGFGEFQDSVADWTGSVLECGRESVGSTDEAGLLGPRRQSSGGLAVERFESVTHDKVLDDLLVEAKLAAQMRGAQVRAAQLREVRGRIAQVGVAQVRVAQGRVAQSAVTRFRAAQVRPAQVRVTQVCSGQVDISQLDFGHAAAKRFALFSSTRLYRHGRDRDV